MGVLMIKCPATGRPVATGIEMEPDSFNQIPEVRARVLCSACGSHHFWSKVDAWVAEPGADPKNSLHPKER
jgi:hypothetical protein